MYVFKLFLIIIYAYTNVFNLFFNYRANFNRERFIICANLVAMCRIGVNEAISWTQERYYMLCK